MSKENDGKIVLGSGKLYCKKQTGHVTDVSTFITELETEENLLGYIQGGATLDYKPEFYTAEDDLGIVTKTTITKEEATLKSGIMTWCGNTLKKLCSTARVTDDAEKGLRIVKIGGIKNYDGENYAVMFVQDDPADGKIWIIIIGSNQAGLSLAFAKDKETVIDAEFTAAAADDEGTKIIYVEEIEKVNPNSATEQNIAPVKAAAISAKKAQSAETEG